MKDDDNEDDEDDIVGGEDEDDEETETGRPVQDPPAGEGSLPPILPPQEGLGKDQAEPTVSGKDDYRNVGDEEDYDDGNGKSKRIKKIMKAGRKVKIDGKGMDNNNIFKIMMDKAKRMSTDNKDKSMKIKPKVKRKVRSKDEGGGNINSKRMMHDFLDGGKGTKGLKLSTHNLSDLMTVPGNREDVTS